MKQRNAMAELRHVNREFETSLRVPQCLRLPQRRLFRRSSCQRALVNPKRGNVSRNRSFESDVGKLLSSGKDYSTDFEEKELDEKEEPAILAYSSAANLLSHLAGSTVGENLKQRLSRTQAKVDNRMDSKVVQWLKRSETLIRDREVRRARQAVNRRAKRGSADGRRRRKQRNCKANKESSESQKPASLPSDSSAEASKSSRDHQEAPERLSMETSKSTPSQHSASPRSQSASGGATAVEENLLPLNRLSIDPSLMRATDKLELTVFSPEDDALANVPTCLRETEWENALARSVLTVYTTELRERFHDDEQKGKSISTEETGGNVSIVAKKHRDKAGTEKAREGISKVAPKAEPRRRPAKAEKHATASGSEKPGPIWFRGAGPLHPEWSSLPDGERISNGLRCLEEHKQYETYVSTLEAFLKGIQRNGFGAGEIVEGADSSIVSSLTTTFDAVCEDERRQLLPKLWRQLVVMSLAFAQRVCEGPNCDFPRALNLIKRADQLAERSTVLHPSGLSELKAFVHDAYAFYYWRRGKNFAALEYAEKAMRAHARLQDWLQCAVCLLHIGAVLSRFARHDEAIRCLGQILDMVESCKLDIGGLAPQKLCLVAVAYHNVAWEQIYLRHITEACMSSQNARRLARLCLSYSNRFLASIEKTHRIALKELSNLRAARAAPTKRKARIFRLLSEMLYD